MRIRASLGPIAEGLTKYELNSMHAGVGSQRSICSAALLLVIISSNWSKMCVTNIPRAYFSHSGPFCLKAEIIKRTAYSHYKQTAIYKRGSAISPYMWSAVSSSPTLELVCFVDAAFQLDKLD